MNFRRDGKTAHDEQREWEAWKHANADLLDACDLPQGVLRSRRDWQYLLHGNWCDEHYGKHVTKTDFDLDQLTPAQTNAFRHLLERTLTDEEKHRTCAAWHHVCPPLTGRP